MTKVVRANCEFEESVIDKPFKCGNLTIFPKIKAYELGFEYERMDIFNETLTNKTLARLKDSYFVHLWNNLTKNVKVFTNITSAYITLAKELCPYTLTHSGEYM